MGFTVCVNLLFVRICFNPNINAGHGVSRQENQLTDINGDGYPDFLESSNDGHLSVRRSTIARTNKLSKVNRPLGSHFEIGYKHVGNTYELPYGKWVLDTVTVFDGYVGDGADFMKYCFEYENGFQERHEREFYGFGTVTTHELDTENNDAIYRSTIQTFDTTNYYTKGLLLNEVLQDANGNRFTERQNVYELKDVINGGTLTWPAFDPLADSMAFPALVETTELFYEGQPNPGIQKRIAYQYDNFGNVTFYQDFGDESPEDLIEATISYHDVPANYIKSIPDSIAVEVQEGVVRRRATTIDDANGNIIQIRQYLEDGTSSDHDMVYDNFGNLKRITRPENHDTMRLHFEFDYDSIVQTYVTEVRDGYGYSSQSVYEYEFGQLLESTDMNGKVIRYAVDARGRTDTITGPYELASGQPYTILFEYFPDASVPYATSKHFDPELGGDIETVTFTDGLSRPLQIKKTGVLFTNEIGLIVSGRVNFDAFGRATKSHYPNWESSGNDYTFNDSFNIITPTTTSYDVLDRQITTVLPDSATTTMAYDIQPDDSTYTSFYTKTVDALGNEKESFADVRGRTRATRNYLAPGGNYILTQFRYNAISELIQVIDDGNNETTYDYDHLGRKIRRTHPDAGTTGYVYDLASNLIEKRTDNILNQIDSSAAILYTYEFERLIQIDYPKNYQNRVQYIYGTPTDTLHNRVGRIKVQQDASGGQEFFYGPLGEVVKNIRTIMINEGNVATYVSENKYDTWNRIQEMIYPDGEVVSYHYNEAGKLRSMTSEKSGHSYIYVDSIGYDEFEQRKFILYGNNTRTDYTYDPQRRWLDQMTVNSMTGPSSRLIMDNNYQYDFVGNILSVNNNAPVVPFKLGGTSSFNYTYDNLYRLTNATGTHSGFNNEQSYTLEMSYDNLHNIISKEQTHLLHGQEVQKTSYSHVYDYNGNQPHAPSQIGNRKYQYDFNGNNLGWESVMPLASYRQILWDEEDRIQAIITDGQLSQYTYDADGERVIKSSGGVQGVFIDGAIVGMINHNSKNYTAYVSPYLVAKEDNFTKHYYIESQRILSKLGTGKFNNKYWPNSSISAGGINYADRMRQLRDSVNAYYASQGIAPGPPTLPGYNTALPFDSLGIGDYTPPPNWPQSPSPPDASGPPGPPTIVNTTDITNDNVSAGFGFADDGLISEKDHYFYHPDHLGNTSYITDIHGSVRQYVAYMAFGETFIEEHTSSSTQPYLFNGKELDRETGLYYYGARYYDPVTSIWQSVDPMGDEDPSYSPFSYTRHNPVILTDPDGKFWHVAVGAAVGAVANVAYQAYQGNISSVSDGLKAAGVGAVAGGLAAATGVAVVGAMGSAGAVSTGVAVGTSSL